MTDDIKLLEAPNEPVEDTDFIENRDFLYKLRKKAMIALDKAEEIMDEHEHPRAVETYAGLLKNIADINNQILRMSKTHKEIKSPSASRSRGVIPLNSDGNGGNITHNTTINAVDNVTLQEALRKMINEAGVQVGMKTINAKPVTYDNEGREIIDDGTT